MTPLERFVKCADVFIAKSATKDYSDLDAGYKEVDDLYRALPEASHYSLVKMGEVNEAHLRGAHGQSAKSLS